MEGAQWMERHLSENNRYDQFIGGAAVNTGSMPAALIQSPQDGAARYNLNVTVAQQSFTLKMVRAGAQASDRCGDFTVTHLGVRAVENYTGFASATAARQECWR
jgi:type IV pilus assembly protein PilE